MSAHLTGLGVDDITEIVESLLVAADQADDHAPQLAERRRVLADQLGDALDELPRTEVTP